MTKKKNLIIQLQYSYVTMTWKPKKKKKHQASESSVAHVARLSGSCMS